MSIKNLTIYPRSRSTIARFVLKRSLKSAILWAIILGIYVASKSIGFAKLYPTVQERAKFASSLGSNSGLSIILGKPHDLTTVAGYTAWNCLGIAVIALSLWAILTTTKYLRGEEVSGRLEILLSGQTSLKKATLGTIRALTASLFILFIIAGVFFSFIGADKLVSFSAAGAIYLSLAMALGGLILMSVSALISQLVSTRGKAVGISASLFGVMFLVKAIGDSTNLTWLTNVSPLGWVENLRPLAEPKPLWLLPITGLVVLCFSLTVILAGKRDLNASLIKDKTESRSRLKLLSGPFALSFRLSWLATLGWTIGITASALFYGLLTKPVIQALADSTSTKKVFRKLVNGSGADSTAAIFVSIIFFITMIVLFFFSAYLINRIRSEEAEGQLDNFIVGPVSRVKWLVSKLIYAWAAIILISILAAAATWLGASSVHAQSLNFHALLLAGFNTIAATLLVLGIGVFVLGFKPRLTAIIVYIVIGWSFLIDMLESGTKLNHYLLDTSLFTNVHLAPAASINWETNMILLGLALVLSLLGLYRFNTRDITSE